VAEAGAFADVLNADVVPADVGSEAIRDDDFAVIAEVDLKPVPPAAAGVEGLHVDAGVAEFRDVSGGEPERTDFIVEEVDADTGLRPGDEAPLEVAAEVVVAHDEKLEQNVGLGGVDGGEDGVEGGVAVDEEAGIVAGGEGEESELLDGGEAPGVAGKGDFEFGEPREEFFDDVVDPAVAFAAGFDVTVELLPPEDEIKRQRDVGKEDERECPGDRALARAAKERGVNRRDDPCNVEEGDEDA